MSDQPTSAEALLALLADGGRIVSTASLSPTEIEQARAEGRMWVDSNFYGYVWERRGGYCARCPGARQTDPRVTACVFCGDPLTWVDCPKLAEGEPPGASS